MDVDQRRCVCVRREAFVEVLGAIQTLENWCASLQSQVDALRAGER